MLTVQDAVALNESVYNDIYYQLSTSEKLFIVKLNKFDEYPLYTRVPTTIIYPDRMFDPYSIVNKLYVRKCTSLHRIRGVFSRNMTLIFQEDKLSEPYYLLVNDKQKFVFDPIKPFKVVSIGGTVYANRTTIQKLRKIYTA